MSKESALGLMTGKPVTQTLNPSLVTGEMPKPEAIESQPEALPAEPKADDLQSNRFAIFAKKEAALVKEREAFKKEREQFLNEKKAADEFMKRVTEFEELRKQGKGVDALKIAGLSDEDIINLLAENEPKEETVEDKARRIALEELGKKEKEREEKESLAQKTRDEQLVKEFKASIADTIKSDASTFEFCSFHGPEAEEFIYEIVDQELKINGRLMDAKEAIEAAEKYYEDYSQALNSLKKKTQTTEPESAETTQQTQPLERTKTVSPSLQAKPKILTNQMSPTVNATLQKRETREEKRLRLEEALRRGHL